MDLFTFFISITLAVAGVFLFRDYSHFLKSTYAKNGKVVSIQQRFYTHLSLDPHSQTQTFIKNGFYPVIECPQEGGSVLFTAIDQHNAGNFHMGDNVDLKIIKSNRQSSRACKTKIILSSLLMILGFGIISAALFSSIQASLGQIFLASSVIAAGLSILVLYARNQDESSIDQTTLNKGGQMQLRIAEPTAFRNWKSTRLDPIQKSKIRHSKFCGITCLGASLMVLAFTFQPFS